jgi:prevent-host-death family protein
VVKRYGDTMTTIPRRELRNNVSDVLRRAQSGERFTITVAGRPVAELGPRTGRDRSACVGDLQQILASTPVDARWIAELALLRGDATIGPPSPATFRRGLPS